MKNFKKSIIFAFGFLLLLGGCSTKNEGATEKSNKINVITTFYPMYEFTQQVAGDVANISMMVPAGADTHHYEPSAKQIGLLNEADVFIYNSTEMETWVPDVLNTLDDSSNHVVVEAAEGISLLGHEDNEEVETSHDDHQHEEDPHVWLDPVLAQTQVETIMKALQKVDPSNKEIYEKNGQAYIEKLKKLNTEFEEAFDGATQRTFVTEHAAFGYLAHRYNLNQLSIAGLSTENEPSPVQLAKLNQVIKDYNLHVVYQNSDTSTNIAATLAQEADVRVETLYSLESLTEKEIESGTNYLSLMEKNLEALKLSIHK